MKIKRYLQIMLNGWWLIVPTIMVSISIALAISYTQAPIYHTEATFVISPSAAFSDPYDILVGLNSISKRDGVMATYAEIARSATVLHAVDKELQLTETQREYLHISSEIIPSTNIIRVSVESHDPSLAKEVADAVGQQTIAYVGSLYEIYDMKSLDLAYVPELPSKPEKAENILLAALLGSIVGVGSAFLLDYVRASEDIAVGLSILDPDIGIYNRRYFLQRLSEEQTRAKRHHRPLSLALMSIDNIDMAAGMEPRLKNEVLRRVGFFLKQYLREEDLVARFEDDVFALLLPDTSGLDAEKVLQGLHTRIQWNVFELDEGIKLNLIPSSGVVAYDLNGTGRDELISELARTLQRAKDDGYGKVHLLQDGE